MKLLSLILIGILTAGALTEGDCKNCAECRSNGEHKWCHSCYKSSMTWTSATKATCGEIGSGLANCLTQVAWEGGQRCTTCADGYVAWPITNDFTTPTVHDPTTGDGTCVQITDTNAAKATLSGTVASPVITSTKCKVGFKLDTATPNQCSVAVVAADEQVVVENCWSYSSSHQCKTCMPGFELVSLAMRDKDSTNDAGKSLTWRACVAKGDNVKGCVGVTDNGNCNSCDVRAGYYSKDVIVHSLPSSSQPQICTKETDGGTFGDIGMI